MIKFSDDTALVDIPDSDVEHFAAVQHFLKWCKENFLDINVQKPQPNKETTTTTPPPPKKKKTQHNKNNHTTTTTNDKNPTTTITTTKRR